MEKGEYNGVGSGRKYARGNSVGHRISDPGNEWAVSIQK